MSEVFLVLAPCSTLFDLDQPLCQKLESLFTVLTWIVTKDTDMKDVNGFGPRSINIQFPSVVGDNPAY